MAVELNEHNQLSSVFKPVGKMLVKYIDALKRVVVSMGTSINSLRKLKSALETMESSE